MILRNRVKNQMVGLLVAAGLGVCAVAAGATEGGAGSPPAINLNTASAGELEGLPGVGEARAKAIIAVREKRGGFKTVDELVEVKGIGKAALEKLRPLVTTGSRVGATPR
jgi:competence protein ComEA